MKLASLLLKCTEVCKVPPFHTPLVLHPTTTPHTIRRHPIGEPSGCAAADTEQGPNQGRDDHRPPPNRVPTRTTHKSTVSAGSHSPPSVTPALSVSPGRLQPPGAADIRNRAPLVHARGWLALCGATCTPLRPQQARVSKRKSRGVDTQRKGHLSSQRLTLASGSGAAHAHFGRRIGPPGPPGSSGKRARRERRPWCR